MAAPSAARINKRAAKDRAFLKRALKNPGLRAKLDPKYLSGPQAKQRALNTRLNAPITEGSKITERDLAHEAGAATTVRYGPQEQQLKQTLGVAQQTERDTGSFYDEYQRNLQAHSAAVQAYQAGAQNALAQTQAGITGLAGQEGAAMQQAANAGAAQQGVAPAGNLMPDANAAAAVRQALIGSFQAQQAQTGAANNQYASSQANVVAPGQKLAAQAQARGRTGDVRKDLTALAQQEGAFNQQFRSERRADEAKQVLANLTLGANVAQDQAQAQAAQSRVTETTRHNKTAEQIARDRNKTAAKTARQRADLAAGKVNQYGYTDAAWRAMSTSQRQNVIKAFKAKPKRPGQKGAGPDWKTSEATSRGMKQLTSLKTYADKAKRGQPFVPGHASQGAADRHAAAQKIQQAVDAPDDPILLTAALDSVYLGYLSPGTVKSLIAAGYKPSRVASTLRVPTGAAGRRQAARRPQGQSSNRDIAANIPGLGSFG